MLPWHGSVKMLGLPTLRSILRTDMSLVFDAILFDRSLYNPLFNYLWTVSRLLPLPKRRDNSTGFYNVRDVDSYQNLRGIGARTDDCVLAADAASTSPSRTRSGDGRCYAGGWSADG